tara:strand:- start:1128 stop:1844 length:717 start_codon:yes stop_codon:yes gene_type:complete
MIFIIGNGTSRKNVNLNILKEHGKVIGCNALYRNFTPDILFTYDSVILHELLSSDYPKNNEVYILNEISFLPEMVYYDIKSQLINPIENDKNDSAEFLSHADDDGNQYISWIPREHKIKFTPWGEGEIYIPYNAGWCAIRLAYLLYGTEEIFMIGFDVFGARNNIYDGTNGYFSSDTPHHQENERVFLFNHLPVIYPDINIRRVIDDGSELENIPSITYENLCQHTRINLKTLISSTQ